MTGRPTHLRIADPPALAPIEDDATALATIGDHWKAAVAEYATLLGTTTPPNLRWLIVGARGPGAPSGGMRRAHFRGMADAARQIAASANRLADHLQRAADVYDRRDNGRPTP